MITVLKMVMQLLLMSCDVFKDYWNSSPELILYLTLLLYKMNTIHFIDIQVQK